MSRTLQRKKVKTANLTNTRKNDDAFITGILCVGFVDKIPSVDFRL